MKKNGAALFAKLLAPAGSGNHARCLRRVSTSDKDFELVGLDHARALHDGRQCLRVVLGPPRRRILRRGRRGSLAKLASWNVSAMRFAFSCAASCPLAAFTAYSQQANSLHAGCGDGIHSTLVSEDQIWLPVAFFGAIDATCGRLNGVLSWTEVAVFHSGCNRL